MIEISIISKYCYQREYSIYLDKLESGIECKESFNKATYLFLINFVFANEDVLTAENLIDAEERLKECCNVKIVDGNFVIDNVQLIDCESNNYVKCGYVNPGYVT